MSRSKKISREKIWVAKLKKLFALKGSSVGIGDDCAVIKGGGKSDLLMSKDLLLEGIHFLKKEPNSPYLIGKKAIAVNLSDIAAMGAQAKYLLIGLAVPKESSDREIAQFFKGIKDQCNRYNVSVLGGDLSSSLSGWFVSVTVLGTPSKRVIFRHLAQVGDDIWVTGKCGESVLGLKAILKDQKIPKRYLKKHLDPEPRLEWAALLSARTEVHSMIDLSDGLLNDLDNLIEASQKGYEVNLESIPRSKNFVKNCHLLDENPVKLMLEGGEDYELLFTAKRSIAFEAFLKCHKIEATKIGRILGSGKFILDQHGQTVQFPAPIHHF